MRTFLPIAILAALGASCSKGPPCEAGVQAPPGSPGLYTTVVLPSGQSLDGDQACTRPFGEECPSECTVVYLEGCTTTPFCLSPADRQKLSCADGRAPSFLEPGPTLAVCKSAGQP